jgi:glycosyltransferase involved in cell wall biosynthesis
MPRVALFCTNFLPYSQSFVFEEIQNHDRYEVEVFCWRRMFEDRFPYEPVHVANPAYIATTYSPAFHKRIAEGSFDLIHAHFGPGATYALPYARKHALPLVVTFHGYDVPLMQSRDRFLPINVPYAMRAPRLLREMSLGLCASRELREILLDMGVPEGKLALYHLGIDLGAFSPGEKDSSRVDVMMVGRFVEKKGFEYGIRAFAQATTTDPSAAHLTIVGSGEREDRLRALVSDLGAGDRVTFAGVLKKEEVADRLRKADILLAPSVVAADGNRESGLIVVKEASACHTVPIGTYHGGIPEIIDDGETGYLVPERDVDTMADRLAQLMADPNLRKQLAHAARNKMERQYNARTQVRHLEALYDQARGQGSPP